MMENLALLLGRLLRYANASHRILMQCLDSTKGKDESDSQIDVVSRPEGTVSVHADSNQSCTGENESSHPEKEDDAGVVELLGFHSRSHEPQRPPRSEGDADQKSADEEPHEKHFHSKNYEESCC